MDLADAAAFFDRTQFNDAYSGAPAFLGQLGLFDDSKRDSESALRRVISTSAAGLVPARRAVTAGGKTYLLGEDHPDEFDGGTIRVGYVVQEATVSVRVMTLREAVLDEPGVTSWGAQVWIKDRAFSEQDSNLTPAFHVHLARSETVHPYDVMLIDGAYHMVRSVIRGAAGFLTSLVDAMANPCRQTASVSSGTYSAQTESWSALPVTSPVLRLRWQSIYQYVGEQSSPFEAGDIQVALPVTVPVAAGTRLGLSDGEWYIRSVLSVNGVQVCRASRRV